MYSLGNPLKKLHKTVTELMGHRHHHQQQLYTIITKFNCRESVKAIVVVIITIVVVIITIVVVIITIVVVIMTIKIAHIVTTK